MVECRNCGEHLRETCKFCEHCGTSVVLPKCQHCGNELSKGTKFCSECGKAVTETAVVQPITVFCPSRNNKGDLCLTPLIKGKKFCEECGWKIDQIIFVPGSRPCTRKLPNGAFCDGIVGGDSTECPLCHRVDVPYLTDQGRNSNVQQEKINDEPVSTGKKDLTTPVNTNQSVGNTTTSTVPAADDKSTPVDTSQSVGNTATSTVQVAGDMTTPVLKLRQSDLPQTQVGQHGRKIQIMIENDTASDESGSKSRSHSSSMSSMGGQGHGTKKDEGTGQGSQSETMSMGSTHGTRHASMIASLQDTIKTIPTKEKTHSGDLLHEQGDLCMDVVESGDSWIPPQNTFLSSASFKMGNQSEVVDSNKENNNVGNTVGETIPSPKPVFGYQAESGNPVCSPETHTQETIPTSMHDALKQSPLFKVTNSATLSNEEKNQTTKDSIGKDVAAENESSKPNLENQMSVESIDSSEDSEPVSNDEENDDKSVHDETLKPGSKRPKGKSKSKEKRQKKRMKKQKKEREKKSGRDPLPVEDDQKNKSETSKMGKSTNDESSAHNQKPIDDPLLNPNTDQNRMVTRSQVVQKSDENSSQSSKESKEASNKATNIGPRPPSNVNIPGSSTKENVGSKGSMAQSGRDTRKHNFIHVVFHAILAPSLIDDPQTTSVFVWFSSNKVSYPLWFKRRRIFHKELKGEHFEYEATIPIEKSILRHSTIFYTYCTQYAGYPQAVAEHFIDVTGINLGRPLYVPEKCLDTGVWHQYDGVVIGRTESNLFQQLISYIGSDMKKMLRKNAELCLSHFLHNIEHILANQAEDALEMVKDILDCLFRIYSDKNGVWQSRDKFENHMAQEAIKPFLERIILEDAKKRESTKSLLTKALAMVCIAMDFNVDLDGNCKTELCTSLMIKPNWSKKTCPDIEETIQAFQKAEKKVNEFLQQFVNKMAETSANVTWIYCVPLLHFLGKKCRPFQEATLATNHMEQKPTWWGIHDFKNSLDSLKGRNWNINVETMIQKMEPLFMVDYLLPRTIMASTSFKQLEAAVSTKLISPDISMATIYYYYNTRWTIQDNEHQMLQGILKTICVQIKYKGTDVDSGCKWSCVDLFRIYYIGYDLLKKSMEYMHKNPQTASEVIVIVANAFATFEKSLEVEKKKNAEVLKMQNQYLVAFDTFRKKVVDWLKNNSLLYREESCKTTLKLWDKVLSAELPHGTINEAFQKELKDQLEELIKNKSNGSSMISMYCYHMKEYRNDIQDILTKFAFEAMKNGSVIAGIRSFGKEQQKEYGKLMSKVFEEHWTSVSEERLFERTVTWAPFVHFIQMFYMEKKSTLLNDECSRQMTTAVSKLQEKITHLETGLLTIKDLTLIQKHFDMFKNIVTAMHEKEKKNYPAMYLDSLLALRQNEHTAYQGLLVYVKGFVNLCNRLEVDCYDLNGRITRLQDLNRVPVNVLCRPAKLSDVEDIQQYSPTVVAFDLDESVLETLPEILKNSDSVAFMNKWDSKGQSVVQQLKKKLSIEETIQLVWEPVQTWWDDLCTMVVEGTISFRKFDKMYRKCDEKQLREEFDLMAGEQRGPWIDERIQQINQYRELQGCVTGAEAILDVTECYELDGDFEPVELITDVMSENSSDMTFNDLDESMMNACKILSEMTEEHVACLRAFIDSKPLVLWLKESMPSGLKELKVFVDLASISAGEGDMEIGKVQCLHAATTGYAPLIFNLTDEIDYEEFLEKCAMVWKELQNDPKLPKKLLDTNRQINWLKTVKQAHGSVEVTSLTQAEAINSVGIYEIGKIQQTQGNKLVLEDVLKLVVAEDDQGTRLRKSYNYGKLHDLQSRLMLVAGKAEKGKDDVDRFTMILDSVVRLSNVYIRLVASGCVLFSSWKTRLLCDRKRKACCFITFGEGKETQQLKGCKEHETDEVSSIVPRLARFMEQCLQEWLKYINEKRDRYYRLNFYTVDQMVILQRELVKIGTDNKPSDLIFPLLSAVKKDCTMEDIVGAMKEAQNDVEHMDEENEVNMEDSEDEEAMEEGQEIDLFIRELKNSGYSESLARKALQQFKPDEVDEAIVWCMDEDEEMETEADVTKQVTYNQTDTQADTFHGWTSTNKSISAITEEILGHLPEVNREVSVDPLIKGLESLWKTFLNSISSSVSDYLSVEHLGLILQRLAGKETFAVERNLLKCFKSGEPNLMICPQVDLLNTVLTIYLHDNKQPLPQPDEVLICSSKTTLDELDTFWRRAIFEPSGRIHCLVSGDLLDYEVSDKGDQYLERHMEKAKDQNIQYRLIVLCSSENEYKSRIVSALDRFRRPHLPVATLPTIKNYLQKQLKLDHVSGKAIPAARVDFDQSTVRVVKSWRAGVGKTLYKTRMEKELKRLYSTAGRKSVAVVTIPLHEREIDVDAVMDRLLECTLPPGHTEPRILHIDISHEVYIGVDEFLFHLLILGCLSNSSGFVWRKVPHDHYLVETMPQLSNVGAANPLLLCMHRCFDVLPDMTCRSPEESLTIMRNVKMPPDYGENDRLFDMEEFSGTVFQRPYQYLKHLDENKSLAGIDPYEVQGDMIDCLQVLLRHCGLRDPSWAEIKHFVWFLNTQLQDFEVSAFCGLAAMEDLPGFAKFVLKFLIQMSRDFATRSLNMSEESPAEKLNCLALRDEEDMEQDQDGDEFIQQYQMKRTWESSPHPYIFFNPDHNSMTFLGFNIDRASGDLLDHQTGRVLDRAIMARNLQDSLIRNKVNINEDFDNLPRGEKIQKLCSVMGMDMPYDPDETYELTTDNVKKILAIYMRFKCDIPVIIMGETGCGKTRLVKFMCSLQCPPGVNVQNMVLMKVHGGTKRSDIIRKVQAAEQIAQNNTDTYGPHLQTVLFFDEANTTEAIGLIKEIMCDKTLAGRPLNLCRSLKMIAACNPYRKHSEDLIKRLEQAGLGYHVDADKTADKLGHVPMRRLVYRVQPLPQSLLPLVWDFGQLDTRVEELYIRQMVRRHINNGKLPFEQDLEKVVSRILTVSQDFLRDLKDECSFVSLRDVERVLEVMSWFYAQTQGSSRLFQLIDDKEDNDQEEEMSEDEDEEMAAQTLPIRLTDTTRSLVLALGVCYHACLKKREQYRETVAEHFKDPCQLPGGADRMLEEIENCQDVFLENVQLGNNIAQNQALKENVFMMVTCIELRIPLFLVGKPGSSKSLAKTIVADAMQGHAAHKALFKEYKTVQMASFQCSPLSVPEGIIGTFRQCANFQKDRDLSTFVSVVVLDEIGLAEDSPRMPLKTLHPLLEDGCDGDEKPEKHKKVGFIGISNWALDPAKMNRGILVQREVPELKELTQSAEGICSSDKQVLQLIKPIVKNMAKSYLVLFEEASKNLREFFGLRDFYSLLKMVYAFADKNKKKPTWMQLQHAILRNFGGMDDIDPVNVFTRNLPQVNLCEKPSRDDPKCTPADLIQACLEGDGSDSESRYLLLLTENYGALNILQQKVGTMHNAITIFGSSFPSDQEYTQVCRNINRIKVCMETGSTVVLLNLENLYESLYDALNQYYVEFGGERYVDLGLGSHRVKCRVHRKFRLIVVAEKQVVYEKFPIPLINRLEKHFLNISTMLTEEQTKLAEKLKNWAQNFAKIQRIGTFNMFNQRGGNGRTEFSVNDVFMGYHADTCAAVILYVIHDIGEDEEKIFEEAKRMLLWCATPDSVMRLSNTPLKHEENFINKVYFQDQPHECLSGYLSQRLTNVKRGQKVFAQITTHSKLITTVDLTELSRVLKIPTDRMMLLTLQSFDTEQQFCRQIRSCLDNVEEEEDVLLVVQSDSGDQNSSLVASARYCIQDEIEQLAKIGKCNKNLHVVFIIQLPRIAGGCFNGFQCGLWHSLHIDDLRPAETDMLTVPEMRGQSIGKLIHNAVTVPSAEEEVMDVVPADSDDEESRNENYGMEVDESDIHVNILSNETRTAHKLPVSSIILSCIQSALAMVKDIKGERSRETERVTILLQLLHHQDHMSATELIMGLSKHLDLLLQEKEKTSHNPGNWLATEASKAENINTAGTFRRALIQCMEGKVTPILAGIIAYIDTNRNLDCLSRSALHSWRQELWLSVINSTVATGMQYDTQLVLPGTSLQKEATEVVVNHTGYEGHVFSADMPFSWLIFRIIEDTVKTTIDTMSDTDDRPDTVQKAREVIMNLAIGRVLQPIVEQNMLEATKAYLRDFVHMVYPVKSSHDHQLICENLHIHTRLMLQHNHGDGLAMIVGYHVSYQQLSSRLKIYANLNMVWPDCSEAIIKFQQKSPNFYLLTEEEMTLDVLGLHLLMEKLEPERDILNKPAGRDEWLRRVHVYRPVVERILDMCTQTEDPKCGLRCCKGIDQARSLWAGVVVVKLFIEHVCSMGGREKDQLSVRRVMPLWTMMKYGVNMKKIESLAKVEKFLRMCNKTAVSQFFDINKDDQCKHCMSVFEGAPVQLPCKDTICTKCYKELTILKDLRCPVCHEDIPENYDYKKDKKTQANYTKYTDYKSRCNSFFMEVVSQLCFADGTAPGDEVVKKLLKYITREMKLQQAVTKEMSIFEDDIDPTPVLRSFLLQLLLRTSGDKVYQHLEEYLHQAQQFLGPEEESLELCLMIIQCVEDSCFYEVSQSENTEKEELNLAVEVLRRSRDIVGDPDRSGVDKLYALAETRFGLTVVAKYIQQIFVEGSRKSSHKIRHLIDAAAQMCQECGTKWPCVFFVKYLCRCYGLESYEKISSCENASICRWIRGLNLQRDEKVECSDSYVVCGPVYTQLRETLTKCLLGDDIQGLEEKLQDTEKQDWQTRTLLLLAVHREITMLNVYPEEKRPVTPNMLEQVADFLTKEPLFEGQDNLIRALMENKLWRRFQDLNIVQGQGLKQQTVCCLMAHAFITLLQLPGDRTLLHPFIKMATEPQTLARAFLPTMPQDDLAEIKEALLQGRRQFNFDENPVFYRCPNGHAYVIGNCGNPASVGVCKECGSAIGGEGYKLRQGNIKDTGEDQTKPGHILGRADKRAVAAVTERKMTPAGCSILRLLTHISMLLGADTNPQAICSMIKPDIEVGGVYDFLMSHIQRDIEIIQKVTGYSFDDIGLILHNLFSTFLTAHNQGEVLAPELCLLTNKGNRNRWEDMFIARYISPLMQSAADDLKIHNKTVAEDKRLGSDPLLCLLYETDSSQEAVIALHEVPSVWRFRKRISIDHLTMEFQNQVKDTNKVLQLFLEEEQHLRALRLIPSIMRLQKMLIQKYQRKLDKAEANTMYSLTEVVTEFSRDGKKEEAKQLINDFSEAWDCVRNSLSTFPCPTMDGFATLSLEYCNRNITMDTNVSMLLPSHRDAGLSSYVLLYFLLKKQNSFLDKYCTAKKQKSKDLPKVKVADLTTAHLISYHRDRDILSIVLANCNYSFQVGQGTTIEYNFDNIERQLMDRFLFSKSYIEIDEIELMTYRSDATNAMVFAILRYKIPQVQLGAAVRHQICTEFKSSLPEICDCLDQLDITISFLKSVGEKPDCSLEVFMGNTLKMRNPLHSQKSRQICQCEHVQSLWLTLAMEKTKCLARHNREVFDSVGLDFRTDLNENQKEKVAYFCDGLQIDKVEFILECLFECIMLRVSASQNPEDENYVDIKNTSLSDFFYVYVENRSYDEEIETPLWMSDALRNLPADPEDDNRLLVSHAVGVWQCLYDSYLRKEKERRR